MNLSCPHCGQGVTYNVELAGKTVKCPNCQKPILMPPLNNLPPKYKKEYLEEEEYMAEQELIQKKEEEKIHKQQKEQLEIAEDAVKTNYPWLSILASIYRVVGIIGLLVCVLLLIFAFYAMFHNDQVKNVAILFVECLYIGLASVTCIAIGELIHLIINVAHDLSGTKTLLNELLIQTKNQPARN